MPPPALSPMSAPPLPLFRNVDEEHLRLLALFHYVVAAIAALFACLPLIHVGMGLLMILHPDFMSGGKTTDGPPAFIGYFIVIMASVFILCGWGAAVCTFLSGRYLAQRRKRMFSFVVAAIQCAFMPFGTVLGIFTIIILSKESVQQLYAEGRAPDWCSQFRSRPIVKSFK